MIPGMTTALRELPLLRWATRFEGGTVLLSGRLVDAVELVPHTGPVVLQAGPVVARLEFVGGPVPALEAAAIDASSLTVHGEAGSTLAAGSEGTAIDGRAVAAVRMDQLVDGLLDHLHDLAVEAAVHTGSDLLVKVSKGVEATLPAHHVVTVRGATLGPPDQPLLDAPLVVSVEGTGVRLTHSKLRWLATLAKVSLQEARLHPNGRIALQAHSRGGRLRGLQRVSDRLSEVVQRSPRFARVRAFLRDGRER
jgi:hypothetical protein